MSEVHGLFLPGDKRNADRADVFKDVFTGERAGWRPRLPPLLALVYARHDPATNKALIKQSIFFYLQK